MRRSGRVACGFEPLKVAALLPAAGRSMRMGAINKLVDPLSNVPSAIAPLGRALVRAVAEEIAKARLHPIVVVTGYEAERVEKALAGLDLQRVHNENYREGMGSSLRCAVAALPADVDAAIVCLGDMPLLRATHIERLVAAFDRSRGCEICVPVFEGRRGHPVLFSRRFFARMAVLEGDQGGRRILAEYEGFVREVPMDDAAVLVDIDSPEDIAGTLGAWPRGDEAS